MEHGLVAERMAESDCSRPAICSLIDFCSIDDRVCPGPSAWHRLWRMLPDNRQGQTPRHPPTAPSDRDAAADNELKWALVDHLLWAEEVGVLANVDRYLRSLPPGQWLLKSSAA